MYMSLDLHTLKEKIEELNKIHQIEVLRILQKQDKITLNENKNGIFINLTNVNNSTIAELKKYLDEVGIIYFETTRIRKDGSEFSSEISARVIEINGLKYYHSIGRDITNRKLAENALQEAELKFRTIFDYT